MHPYATDSHEREQITFGLAVISVAIALGLSRCLAAAHLTIPSWFGGPSTMGIFGIAYKTFDMSLWRQGWVRRTGLVKVAVLDGNWRGHVRSSFDQHSKEHEVSVRI